MTLKPVRILSAKHQPNTIRECHQTPFLALSQDPNVPYLSMATIFRDISYVCVYYLTRVDVSHFAIVAHTHTQTEEETPTTTNISERNNCFICHAPSFTFVFVYFCCCCGCCCRFFCVRFTLALSLSLSCQHRVLRILVFVSEQAINRQSEKHKPLLLIMIVVRNILCVYIFFAFVLSFICLSWLCHLCI